MPIVTGKVLNTRNIEVELTLRLSIAQWESLLGRLQDVDDEACLAISRLIRVIEKEFEQEIKTPIRNVS